MRLAVYEDGVSVRSRKVEAPLEKPRVEVATHWVLVPVVCRTIPEVPAELSPSRNSPPIYACVRVVVPVTPSVPEKVAEAPAKVPEIVGEVPNTRSEERRVGKECRSRW